jgi:hypothetical protein
VKEVGDLAVGHVTVEKRREIDGNLERFLPLLASLLAEHEGQYALMRHGEIMGFFDTAIDAQIAGNQRFEDGLFSFQLLRDEVEELGLWCHALRCG